MSPNHTLSLVTGTADDRPPVAFVGVIVCTGGDIGADDGRKIVETVGSILAANGISDNGVAVGGSERVATTGFVVKPGNTVGAGVPTAG